MVIYRTRGETVGHTETIRLQAQFRGPDGNPADLDALPTITIEEPSGNVVVGPTNLGVYRSGIGLYGYDFPVGWNACIGVWNDIWDGTLNGFRVSGAFNFVVQNTMMPAVNTDGYEHLGDDPGFCYSQLAIHNINVLLKSLRARLDSRGKVNTTDEWGNDVYVDCDIYGVDNLVSFLGNSLTMFNEIPHWTLFTFEDTEILQQFHDVIVEGAELLALSSKMLLERGREFQLTDQGINFNPPSVAELMNSRWSTLLTHHFEKVKLIKFNMKPSPIGLGTLTISTARYPAIARMRFLRARQIY